MKIIVLFVVMFVAAAALGAPVADDEAAAAVPFYPLPIPDVPFDVLTEENADYGGGGPPFFEVLPGDRREVFYQSNGLERDMVVYVPSTAPPGAPLPLVFSYHGFGSTPRQQELLTFFSSLAEDFVFLAVFPNGVGRSHNSGPSCCPPAYPNVDDVQNARDIIAVIDTTVHPVNRSRVYSNGMSNGGYMSTRLACDAADVFAAVGSVTGANPYPDMAANCHPSRPVPYFHSHGIVDSTVPYDRAELTVDFMLGVNGCDKAAGVETYRHGEASCMSWTQGCRPHGGAGATNTTFCTIADGTHSWPGNPIYNSGSTDMAASVQLINFFYRYSL